MRWWTTCVALTSLIPYALLPSYGFSLPQQLEARQNDYPSGSLLHDYPGQHTLPTLELIQKLNATNGTFLPLEEIQGDIMIGMRKPKEIFFFYSIQNPRKFKSVLAKFIYPHITTTAQMVCTTCTQPSAMLNVAWTSQGLRKLGVLDDLGDPYFAMGQLNDAAALGDTDPSTMWAPGLYANKTDGAFLIAARDWEPIDTLLSQMKAWLGDAIVETHSNRGAVRPGDAAGKEHFGWLDGFIQPAVAGFATSTYPGQQLLLPGTLLTKEIGDPRRAARPAWTKWGSFMAYRQLQELVPEFDDYLMQEAALIQDSSRSVRERADLLGARMFGRWKSGTPLDLAPERDDPSIGPNLMLNNNFDFNHPAPFDISSNQSYCPFSAHIRKIRPRADQGNQNLKNQMIRASIPYGEELSDDEINNKKTATERGVAFVTYQSDLGSGFHFQQAEWANNVNIPDGKSDPTPGFDPIVGQNSGKPLVVSGIDYTDLDHDLTFMSFVISKGGDYFFSPSMSAILHKIAA
ncbi:dye decolorizing peroxidase [Pleurotus eryngii]|uniref:Dye decolorizing peroxidase n=1 Tax=Pleurotus eryngii TaxID=5323 RepID=A0A9P5ZX51_PLEER|nr:dye decolorizing peroxidase [Pleurotus eryngii]